MDKTRFTSEMTGDLVSITTEDGPDYAFVPDPLPPKWEFPAQLWPLLADAQEQLARLDEKGRTIGNPSLLLSPLQKREAIRSSSIEGTYTTAKDLLLFELAPTGAADKSDVREVSNYDEALRFGVRNLKEDSDPSSLPLSKRLIQEMHRILMTGVRGGEGQPGEFRTAAVYVGAGRRFIPPPPDRLKQCINDFEVFLHSHAGRFHPLVLSYLVHYQFEAVHPFRDGNGRTGRLLLALTTYSWCKLHLPWLYMSPYFERFKDEYIDNMFRISTHGDWEKWIEFCLHGTAAQCADAIRRCDGLRALRTQMRDELNRYPRLSAIIESMFVRPIFTAAQVAQWGNTSLPTARRDIEIIEKAGYIHHLAGARPKHYYVPGIFAIAYREGTTEEQPGGASSQPSEPTPSEPKTGV